MGIPKRGLLDSLALMNPEVAHKMRMAREVYENMNFLGHQFSFLVLTRCGRSSSSMICP